MKTTQKRKKIYGIGVNDADYVVHKIISGRRVPCPFYKTWRSMLTRCYSHRYKALRPTYEDCSVVPEWHSFMAFRSWMMTQDWHGNQLDKDLLSNGVKIYSPSVCIFVSSQLNGFILDCAAARGDHPVGVSYQIRIGRYIAQCCNPFTGKCEYLGVFSCSQEAHEAWMARKHKYACRLAEMQSDPRLAAALRTRYSSEAAK